MEKAKLLNDIINKNFLKDLQNLENKIYTDSTDLNNIKITINNLNGIKKII